MTTDENIQAAARAELLQYLQKQNGTVLAEEAEKNGIRLKIQRVLLALYMSNMEPYLYLIPSTVFAMPNNIFIDNEEIPRFKHFSNWQIKVFVRGIPELSVYALDTTVIN